ncbi:MAG: TerB family tellurite resistance protein [Planctomycetes bacterium]|nr:TerB family tellurite resistance protein [Planctomycetota bacterium]
MKFVCSFAWTDLTVSQAERDMVMRMCGSLKLTESETDQVTKWLELPPPVEEVNPTKVPKEHRQMFLTTLEMIVKADGKVVPAESESLQLFRDLLSGGDAD